MSNSSDDAVINRGPRKAGPPGKRPPGGPPRPGSADGPPGPPPPGPAVRKQAPGVRGSQQAPESATLKTGDSLGGRFFVERYLGSSGGGVSYLCNDKETQSPVVVKVLEMPYPGDEKFKKLRAEVGVASSLEHRNLTSAVGMGKTKRGEIFIAMEFVEGTTLSQLIAQRREEGRTLSLRDAFTVLAHACDALGLVHQRKISHGVLTPYNIYVNKSGVVKVGNLAFGRMVSVFLHKQGVGPFVDSIYVAPEVSEDPSRLTPQSDIYSLGMIAAELLSPTGLPNERKKAHDMAVDVVSNYPPALFSLISSCLSRDFRQRPKTVQIFRDDFEEVARDAGAKLVGPPPPGALPVEPAVQEAASEEGDELFDLFDLGDVSGPDSQGDDRYLVQKSGLDYGPFTEDQILEQLYADEIDEFSLVLDRTTQERFPLQDIEVFRPSVEAYIPEREERLRREAEARAELHRKVKKGGVAFIVMGIVGGIVVLLAMGWFWLQRPSPEPLPLDRAFASLDYSFSPPPSEFQSIAVDSAVMESIFNPAASEEEVAQHAARARSQRSSSSPAAAARPSQGQEVVEVDMTGGGGSTHHLTDREINQVITAGAATMRRCVMQELENDRSFRGVTVQFFITPSGSTGGVTLKESQYQNRQVGQCLIRYFRNLQFPEHGAISNRGVEYPLLLQ